MAEAAPVRDAVAVKGWWRAHKWLALRRTSQAAVLALFFAGPLFGLWLLDGNLASSRVFGTLNLTDPFVLAQQLAAGYRPAAAALSGAAIVAAFYVLVGGRAFCSWVCPVNFVTDAACWLRRRIGLRPRRAPPRATRHWLLAGSLVAAALTGSLAWEVVNPVTLLPRGLLFGMGWGGAVIAAVFVYDLLVAHRGWCGHLCPMGAFYGLIGRLSLARVSAPRRRACTDCGECFAVCPEPQVIAPALKGTGTPVVRDADCTNCGRCIDVCAERVFRMTVRFDRRVEAGAHPNDERLGPGPGSEAA
jgi:ferredoxin-type protein NapH